MANLEAQKVFVDEIPTTGEADYDAVRASLLSKGQRDAVSEFHRLRRAGKIVVRIQETDDGVKMYVSRPS